MCVMYDSDDYFSNDINSEYWDGLCFYSTGYFRRGFYYYFDNCGVSKEVWIRSIYMKKREMK